MSDLQNKFLTNRFCINSTASNFHFSILELILTAFKSQSSIEEWILKSNKDIWSIWYGNFLISQTISEWIYGACFLDKILMICTRSAIDQWIANMIDVISMKVIFFNKAQLEPLLDQKSWTNKSWFMSHGNVGSKNFEIFKLSPWLEDPSIPEFQSFRWLQRFLCWVLTSHICIFVQNKPEKHFQLQAILENKCCSPCWK